MGRYITITLSPEAKHAWKWLQTYLIAALTVAPTLYEQLDVIQDYLPPAWFRACMGVLGVLTLLNHMRAKRR